MNSFKYILSSFIFLFILGSCKNESNYVIENNPNEFAITPIAIPVKAEGGTYELKITGNQSWTAELADTNTKTQGWCTLSQTSGIGAGVITITVSPSNSFVKNRTVLIDVNSSSKILKSKVIQATQVLGENEVLINGQVWSTVNIGEPGSFVNSPDDIGMLYQFNRKIGYAPGGQGDPAPSNWPTNYVNDKCDWQLTNDPSPDGWRIPTTQEMVNLWNIGATWVSKSQTGFDVDGIIIGIVPSVAATATKDNLKQLGGLFLPESGWRNESGVMDKTWLVAIRSATAISNTNGGMSLGDSGGYRDIWGWGDGQKARAAMIRPVKNISIEE